MIKVDKATPRSPHINKSFVLSSCDLISFIYIHVYVILTDPKMKCKYYIADYIMSIIMIQCTLQVTGSFVPKNPQRLRTTVLSSPIIKGRM